MISCSLLTVRSPCAEDGVSVTAAPEEAPDCAAADSAADTAEAAEDAAGAAVSDETVSDSLPDAYAAFCSPFSLPDTALTPKNKPARITNIPRKRSM